MSTDARSTLPGEEQLAKDLFNAVWTLLEREDRSPADDVSMIHLVHASCYHWSRVGTVVNEVRGEWQCSRVYSVLRLGESALYHARRALQVCEANGIGDFDLAFCYEALARAHAVTADWDQVQHWMQLAKAAAANIAEADDRELLTSDLETIPSHP
jgi:hypothetical protein